MPRTTRSNSQVLRRSTRLNAAIPDPVVNSRTPARKRKRHAPKRRSTPFPDARLQVNEKVEDEDSKMILDNRGEGSSTAATSSSTDLMNLNCMKKQPNLARILFSMWMKTLEDHFTCALCFEIMAHPYTLTPAQCGHTFCGICVAKLFFSRLHSGCGTWHQSVDCPMCRALLILTPEELPRSMLSIPFVPNRAADAVIRELVSNSVACVKDPNEKDPVLGLWTSSGESFLEWIDRDNRGRTVMQDIETRWASLDTDDLIQIKTHLGV